MQTKPVYPAKLMPVADSDKKQGGEQSPGLRRTSGLVLASLVLLAAPAIWRTKPHTGERMKINVEATLQVAAPARLDALVSPPSPPSPTPPPMADMSLESEYEARFVWDAVPPFRMDMRWTGLEPTATLWDATAETKTDAEIEAELKAMPARDDWREPSGLFFRPDLDPRVIRYKIDPSFGFENRERLLKGMMFRMQINF